MVGVPIDVAEITSIRLVANLAALPIPPPGRIQLGYLPGSGLVARFPNGDYAGLSGIAPAGPSGPQGAQGVQGLAGPAGPPGSGAGDELVGSGGTVAAHPIDDPDVGITIFPEPGKQIKLAGPVQDALGEEFQTLKRRSVVLTTEQLLALHTTSVTLVPAQGVGTVIEPRVITARYFPGSTPFVTGTQNFDVGWGPEPGNAVFTAFGEEVMAGTEGRVMVAKGGDENALPLSAVENQPLTIKRGGPMTLGNGVLRVTTDYMVS